MRIYTGFLGLSSVQVQRGLTHRYLTHTDTAVLQSNSKSVAKPSICFFLDVDLPGVGLAAVASL